MAVFLHLMARLVFPVTKPQIGVLVIPGVNKGLNHVRHSKISKGTVAFILRQNVSHNQISETVNSLNKSFLFLNTNPNRNLPIVLNCDTWRVKHIFVESDGEFFFSKFGP